MINLDAFDAVFQCGDRVVAARGGLTGFVAEKDLSGVECEPERCPWVDCVVLVGFPERRDCAGKALVQIRAHMPKIDIYSAPEVGEGN
jgi:hypothetical protein